VTVTPEPLHPEADARMVDVTAKDVTHPELGCDAVVEARSLYGGPGQSLGRRGRGAEPRREPR
jgi:hypothetical protein